jgi:hypothetical protein
MNPIYNLISRVNSPNSVDIAIINSHNSVDIASIVSSIN